MKVATDYHKDEDVLAGGGAELGAITEGFQSAFLASVGFAIIGALVALLLLRRGALKSNTRPHPTDPTLGE